VVKKVVFDEVKKLVLVWVLKILKAMVQLFKLGPRHQLFLGFLGDFRDIIAEHDAHLSKYLALEVRLRDLVAWNASKKRVLVVKVGLDEVTKLLAWLFYEHFEALLA